MNEFIQTLGPSSQIGLAALAGGIFGILLCALFMYSRQAGSRARIAVLEQALNDRMASLELQAQQYDELQDDYRILDGRKEAMGNELAAALAEKNHLQALAGDLRQQLQIRESQQQTLQATLAGLEKKLATQQSEMQHKQQSLDELRQQFAQSKAQLAIEFQNLADRIFTEKEQAFSRHSQVSMESLLKPFREQIDRFQSRINEVHDQSVQGQSLLQSQIRQMFDVGMKMTQDADALARALKGDKKTLGNWGEMQLERALEMAGLVKGDHFQTQAHFRNEAGQSQLPDFVLYLPDGKHLVIDSKVSLNDYQKAVNATQDGVMQSSLDAHAKAVRNHIDQLSDKNYSNLQGMHSPGFVLMFMPVEAAYIEALRHPSNLFQYGYEKGVVLVSHTTLMPVLRTVSYLWMMARSNEQAAQIGDRAVDIYNQVTRVAEHLSRLGGTLNTVGTHYNAVVGSLAGRQGLIGKVERFNELSAKASRKMVEPEPIHPDFDVSRLDALASNGKPQ